MQSPATWTSGHATAPEPVDLRALHQARLDAAYERERAVRAARMFWDGCAPLRNGHPYLAAKNIAMRGAHELRVDDEGWLVVPAYIGAELVSLQRIAPDGTKRFWRGAPIGGTSYQLRHRTCEVTILTEGLATGIACYMAEPTSRVVVCWDAGNLARVATVYSGLVVIAADNDHGTAARTGTNPGIAAAEKAAATLGCGIAYPTDIVGTDWADLRVERIAAKLAKQYNGRPSRDEIERAVDSEIRHHLMSRAKFVTLAKTVARSHSTPRATIPGDH